MISAKDILIAAVLSACCHLTYLERNVSHAYVSFVLCLSDAEAFWRISVSLGPCASDIHYCFGISTPSPSTSLNFVHSLSTFYADVMCACPLPSLPSLLPLNIVHLITLSLFRGGQGRRREDKLQGTFPHISRKREEGVSRGSDTRVPCILDVRAPVVKNLACHECHR